MIQLENKRYMPEPSANARPPSYKIHNGIVYLSGQVVNMRSTGAMRLVT